MRRPIPKSRVSLMVVSVRRVSPSLWYYLILTGVVADCGLQRLVSENPRDRGVGARVAVQHDEMHEVAVEVRVDLEADGTVNQPLKAKLMRMKGNIGSG